jgi:hypothetical protein
MMTCVHAVSAKHEYLRSMKTHQLVRCRCVLTAGYPNVRIGGMSKARESVDTVRVLKLIRKVLVERALGGRDHLRATRRAQAVDQTNGSPYVLPLALRQTFVQFAAVCATEFGLDILNITPDA